MPRTNRFTTSTRRTFDTTGLSIIIMHGTVGFRSKSYGNKALLKLENRCLLQYQVDSILQCFPDSELIVTTGFQAGRVIKKFGGQIKFVENTEYESSNYTGELRLALNNCINKRVIIIDGSVYFSPESISNFDDDQSAVVYSDSLMSKGEIGITTAGDLATVFSFGMPNKWCGIAYLMGNELKAMRKIVNEKENASMFVHEVLNEIIENDGVVRTVSPPNMYVYKIDTPSNMDNIKL